MGLTTKMIRLFRKNKTIMTILGTAIVMFFVHFELEELNIIRRSHQGDTKSGQKFFKLFQFSVFIKLINFMLRFFIFLFSGKGSFGPPWPRRRKKKAFNPSSWGRPFYNRREKIFNLFRRNPLFPSSSRLLGTTIVSAYRRRVKYSFHLYTLEFSWRNPGWIRFHWVEKFEKIHKNGRKSWATCYAQSWTLYLRWVGMG